MIFLHWACGVGAFIHALLLPQISERNEAINSILFHNWKSIKHIPQSRTVTELWRKYEARKIFTHYLLQDMARKLFLCTPPLQGEAFHSQYLLVKAVMRRIVTTIVFKNCCIWCKRKDMAVARLFQHKQDSPLETQWNRLINQLFNWLIDALILDTLIPQSPIPSCLDTLIPSCLMLDAYLLVHGSTPKAHG